MLPALKHGSVGFITPNSLQIVGRPFDLLRAGFV